MLEVDLRRIIDGASNTVAAWIDTGFTVDLVLPQTGIDDMGLEQSGTVSATVADGSRTVLSTYECFILWFDEWEAARGGRQQRLPPLLGVGLLLGRALTIDFRLRQVTLD